MTGAVGARAEARSSEAALVKDLGTEFEQAHPDGDRERLLAPSPGVARAGAADCCARSPTSPQMAPSFSLRGGTREILRGMIARGLGLR